MKPKKLFNWIFILGWLAMIVVCQVAEIEAFISSPYDPIAAEKLSVQSLSCSYFLLMCFVVFVVFKRKKSAPVTALIIFITAFVPAFIACIIPEIKNRDLTTIELRGFIFLSSVLKYAGPLWFVFEPASKEALRKIIAS